MFGLRCTVGIIPCSGHDHASSSCLSEPYVAVDPGACGCSGFGARLAFTIPCSGHDHVSTSCLSVPYVAVDPGACGCSGFGARLA